MVSSSIKSRTERELKCRIIARLLALFAALLPNELLHLLPRDSEDHSGILRALSSGYLGRGQNEERLSVCEERGGSGKEVVGDELGGGRGLLGMCTSTQ